MGFFDSGGLTTCELLALPHSTLRSRTKGEYSSACPVCGGHDRFRFWPSVGNYWCRRCEIRGFVGDAPERKGPSLRQIINSKITYSTSECYKWLEYHSLLLDTPEALVYWELALGRNYIKAVDFFGLGYCSDYKTLGPTVTIPLGYSGRVYAVKHRILGKNSNGKYISEPSGRGSFLFNIDNVLDQVRIVIAEGEKKAIRLWLEGYPAIASSAGASFPNEWGAFINGKEVYLIFDPDEAGKDFARRMVERYGATNIELPGKVDDLINEGFDIRSVLGEPWMKG